MNKIAFLFPGVGSQYTGMSRFFYDNFEIAARTFEEASEILKTDIPGLCFEATRKEELDRLENAQLVLLTAGVALYRVYMAEVGIEPHCAAGHSLGEYTALCCAGVLEFPDALNLVRERARIIKKNAQRLDGTMAWVINMENRIVEEVCDRISGENAGVFISAYDSSTQTSISGHTAPLMAAAKILEKKGAIIFPLKFSGPFHSPLMTPAAQEMETHLQTYDYKHPQWPVIANPNLVPYQGPESVVENLSQQLRQPIRWQDTVDYFVKQGVDTAVEMAPKNVLKFLTLKNTTAITTYTMDKEKDYETLKEKFLIREDGYLEFIAQCLGLVISSKNSNPDNNAYSENILEPYRKVAKKYMELKNGSTKPAPDHVKEALEMTRHAMKHKHLAPHRQERQLERLFAGKTFGPQTGISDRESGRKIK
ncbi:MAG: ACP S-malonyltransferase [bacterium]|nr:ACP S-malonyltransferase [bacterium]